MEKTENETLYESLVDRAVENAESLRRTNFFESVETVEAHHIWRHDYVGHYRELSSEQRRELYELSQTIDSLIADQAIMRNIKEFEKD